jgi:hypothetical protein
LSIINKWGANWINQHTDEENLQDNCKAQWCIAGDYFDAETHDVTEAALAFAKKHPALAIP